MKILQTIELLAVLLSGAVAAQAQITTLPLDGAKLFSQYCASCHGARAVGDGPMASVLKSRPADLTLISKRNGGVFPLDKVQEVIGGEKPAGLSHGTRAMPVWGPVFSQDISDRDYGKLRLYNVAKFLESIQKK